MESVTVMDKTKQEGKELIFLYKKSTAEQRDFALTILTSDPWIRRDCRHGL